MYQQKENNKMLRLLTYLSLLSTSILFSTSANALLITTNGGDGADSFITENIKTAVKGGNDNFSAFWGPNNHNNTSVGYLRFDLSSVTDQITSASLILTSRGSSNIELEFYGLNDGHAGENWIETGAGGLNWNNAPGSPAEFTGIPDSGSTTSLGTVNTFVSANNDLVFSSSGLLNFLNADTSGFVTILLRDNYLSSSFNLVDASFYSKEFGNVNFMPRLDITTVPVPAAVWMLGSALVGLFSFRKKGNF
jgi:hypothetical protein